ncbi:MAG: hypothetical protein ACOYS2_02160 [Patescibacteria group bacterium]
MEKRVAVAIATIILEDMFVNQYGSNLLRLGNTLARISCRKDEIRETLEVAKEEGSVINVNRAAIRFAVYTYQLTSKKLGCVKPGEILFRLAMAALSSWRVSSIWKKISSEKVIDIDLKNDRPDAIERMLIEIKSHEAAEEFVEFIAKLPKSG